MLIPDPFYFGPAIFHNNEKFSQALGIKAVIIRDTNLRPKPELGVDAIPAHMNMGRLTGVALIGVEEKPVPFVAKDDWHGPIAPSVFPRRVR